MLIIAILAFGLLVGGLAQLILGRAFSRIDWPLAFVLGIVGSFLGGTALSLLYGDGFALKASGLVGSLVGALVATAIWQWWCTRRSHPAAHG